MLAFKLEKMSKQSVPSQKDAKKMREAEATKGLREEERKFLVTLQMLEKVDLKCLKKTTSVYCLFRLRSQKQGSLQVSWSKEGPQLFLTSLLLSVLLKTFSVFSLLCLIAQLRNSNL